VTCTKNFPAASLRCLKCRPGTEAGQIPFPRTERGFAGQLQKLASAGKLRDLKGFGEKLETNILKGLAVAKSNQGRMLLWEARLLMREILSHLKEAPGVLRMEPAGSLRRGKETIGDLDVLCATKKSRGRHQILHEAAGRPNKSWAPATRSPPCCSRTTFNAISASSILPASAAALQYFTGSKEHNVKLRERPKRWDTPSTSTACSASRTKKQSKPLATKTEEEIYAKLGLQYIPPEMRRTGGDRGRGEKQNPKLVEEKDIKGCFHNHTTESDGDNTLEEMAEAARKKGWEWFVSGDHSPSLKVARGLEPERLFKKMRDIQELNKRFKDFKTPLRLGSGHPQRRQDGLFRRYFEKRSTWWWARSIAASSRPRSRLRAHRPAMENPTWIASAI